MVLTCVELGHALKLHVTSSPNPLPHNFPPLWEKTSNCVPLWELLQARALRCWLLSALQHAPLLSLTGHSWVATNVWDELSHAEKMNYARRRASHTCST